MNQALARWQIDHYSECGESALIFYFSGTSILAQNQHVAALFAAMSAGQPEWLCDLVPGFDTLMLSFDALSIDVYGVIGWLSTIPQNQNQADQGICYQIEIDYKTGDDFDLGTVGSSLGLTFEEVISLHQQHPLRVYAIGFAPQFGYLGILPPALNVARLAKPRVAVPAGSVAIADSYSAIYPMSSPGGWQLLGTVADLDAFRAIDLRVGDSVQFTTHSIAKA